MYKAITLAILNLSGNIPVHSAWLIIMLNNAIQHSQFVLAILSQLLAIIVTARSKLWPEISYDIFRSHPALCKPNDAAHGVVRQELN